MPLYEYKCEKCGNVLEVIQKFSDDPIEKCPKCAGAMSKLISNTSFVLKGGGWYADGYASGKSGSSSSDSSSSKESKPAAESKTSSEAKPSTESKPSSEAKPKETASAS